MTVEGDVDPAWMGRVGLGAMHLSEAWRPERHEAISLMHAAFDAGVRLIDTADAYCRFRAETGHNELLAAEAVRTWDGPREEITVATKGGHRRDERGGWYVDGRPDYLVTAARRSRDRLGVEAIALWQWHRPDPDTPLRSSLAGVARVLEEGIARRVGVSNVTGDQLQQVASTLPVASVQNQLSPFAPEALAEVLWCHQRRIPFIAWGPLGGRPNDSGNAHRRQLDAFAAASANLGVSAQRIVLAWLLSLSPVVTVIPGSTRRRAVLDNIRAVEAHVDGSILAQLDAAVAHLATAAARAALFELRSLAHPGSGP